MEKYISRRVDINELVKMLKKALVKEITGKHLYWKYAYNVVGYERKAVEETFRKIMEDECKHADKIAIRIKELGHDVKCDWKNMEQPEEPMTCSSCELVQIMLRDEEKLADLYYEIMQYTENNDHITFDLISHIMKEEQKHIMLLEEFEKDFTHIKKWK